MFLEVEEKTSKTMDRLLRKDLDSFLLLQIFVTVRLNVQIVPLDMRCSTSSKNVLVDFKILRIFPTFGLEEKLECCVFLYGGRLFLFVCSAKDRSLVYLKIKLKQEYLLSNNALDALVKRKVAWDT